MRIRWRGLELPSRVALDNETGTPTYGAFTAEPFERGFGATIGNSLRRILLSSLEGSAVSQVKIQSVQHEFATIPGVVEDVTDICLNLKSLIVKNHSSADRVLRIERHERGVVTGADVITDDKCEVVNKDLLIATMTDDVPLNMELTVKNGRGYVPASEQQDDFGQELGVIPLDATYSPVVRVRYKIEDTRVGQRTNYDKLIMEIWTDGTITPEMALIRSRQDHAETPQPVYYLPRTGPGSSARWRFEGYGRCDRLLAARPGTRRKTGPESGRTQPLCSRHQLPRVRRHQHGARSGKPCRRATAAGAKLRRNNADRSSRAIGCDRLAARYESARNRRIPDHSGICFNSSDPLAVRRVDFTF